MGQDGFLGLEAPLLLVVRLRARAATIRAEPAEGEKMLVRPSSQRTAYRGLSPARTSSISPDRLLVEDVVASTIIRSPTRPSMEAPFTTRLELPGSLEGTGQSGEFDVGTSTISRGGLPRLESSATWVRAASV